MMVSYRVFLSCFFFFCFFSFLFPFFVFVRGMRRTARMAPPVSGRAWIRG